MVVLWVGAVSYSNARAQMHTKLTATSPKQILMKWLYQLKTERWAVGKELKYTKISKLNKT